MDENYNKKTLIYNKKMNFFYFEIAIPMPIRGSFIYKCNSFLRNGSRVEVSFRNRTVMGIVIQQVKKKPEFTVKEVKKICEKEPIFNKKELDCLIWASKYYHHPIGDVFNTFTPKLLKTRKKGLELEKQYEEESYELNNPEDSFRLTNEQINAIENIKVDDIIGSIISKNEDEDTVFKAKLAIMELDDVKKSKDTKLKQEIRKAKTLIEVVSHLQKVMK